MLGTHANPIQIDDARFVGRRKYNRGRMLGGDKPPANTDEGAQVQNNCNHGAGIDGPWVFGLKHGNDSRYFCVERRDKDTLLPIIKRECEGGSVIHSDEWPSYRCLTSEGFIHETVNHQENYVDPLTGAHTQGVERSWLDTKKSILKKKRHTYPYASVTFGSVLLEDVAEKSTRFVHCIFRRYAGDIHN